MSGYVFEPPEVRAIPIRGSDDLVPIHRIFCVGRNYAAHAAEMGGEVDREAPWYFLKDAHHYTPSGSKVAYAPGTSNLHHEMELAFVIGLPVFREDVTSAAAAIWGYACALDMTRRDRQQDGKDHRRPWDLGKNFEHGAIIAPVTRAGELGPLDGRRIRLAVNGETRQDATLDEMVWSCPEIVAHLSQFYHLHPGDVVLTGTPAGVGPVKPGDELVGTIDGLDPVRLAIGAPE